MVVDPDIFKKTGEIITRNKAKNVIQPQDNE